MKQISLKILWLFLFAAVLTTAVFGFYFFSKAAAPKPLSAVSGATSLTKPTADKKSPELKAATTTPVLGEIASDMKIPILIYHYVEHVLDQNDKLRIKMNITPETLEQQVKSLQSRGYEMIFVKDIPAIISSRTQTNRKPVALTFDDGYEDFYTDAFPILKALRAKATLYVIADYIGNPAYVSESQLREMVDSGLVEIGSHTLGHPHLKKLSLERAKQEIVDSKRKLQDTLNIKVETFSYPYG
ncbi:MAG: polysaccharide deacetylase family protein [bacterium]|nr:polysaccharide deacetylase family protein [bacterium]